VKWYLVTVDWLSCQSAVRVLFPKKSAPIIGAQMSATTAKHTSQSQIQSERMGTESRYGGPINCSKARALLFVLTLHR